MAEAWTPLLSRDPIRIGPYQLAGRLGAGGMGVVYLAWSQERPVAVKVMRDELASDAHFRARFAREVEVLRKIGGTCTVAVLDADADADPPYLVTEYVPGPSLSAYVAEHGPMDAAQVTALGAGLAEALHAIHSAGIVHRDLKPSNVLLTPNGPKVIDFGIAQVADATALTQSATSLGSPGYLAPEQVRGLSNTAAADVFTWGATVAYAATGRPPFGLGAADAVLFRVLHDAADLANWSAPQLRPLVEAALSKAPADRPTPRELIQALLPDDSTARLPPADATAKLLAHTWYLPSDATLTLPQPGVPVAAPARRSHRAAWYAAAAATGALLGGASLVAFPAHPHQLTTRNTAASQQATSAPSPTAAAAAASSTPAPTVAATQAAPPPPTVRTLLRNPLQARLPAGLCEPDAAAVTLKDGSGPTRSTKAAHDWGSPTFYVAVSRKPSIAYGDLNGDGILDAAITGGCEGFGGGNNHFGQVFVVTTRSGVLTTLASVSPSNAGGRGADPQTLQITGSTLMAQNLVYLDSDPNCCPTGHGTTTWRWDGGVLRQTTQG